jgi:hypothetical protein
MYLRTFFFEAQRKSAVSVEITCQRLDQGATAIRNIDGRRRAMPFLGLLCCGRPVC